jgi:hypothetical protein
MQSDSLWWCLMTKGTQPPSQSKGQDDGESTAAGKPIAVRIVNALPTSDDQKQNHKDNYGLQRKSYIVGVITLVVLIGYTTINYCLYEVTVSTEQVSQRAFVFSKELELYNGLLVVPIENSGSTPAENLIVRTNRHIWKVEDPWPANYDFPDSVPGEPEPGMLGPKQIGAAPLIPMSPVCAQLLWQGKLKMLVWGRLSYSDIFGDSHTTFFCWQYLGRTTNAEGHLIDISFPCPWQNCTDDQCRKHHMAAPRRAEWQSDEICGEAARSLLPSPAPTK